MTRYFAHHFLNKIFNFGSLCTPQVVAKLFEFQPLLHRDSLEEPHGELQLGPQLKRAMSLSGDFISLKLYDKMGVGLKIFKIFSKDIMIFKHYNF